MKRIVTALTLAAMAISFSACGDSSTPGSATQPSATDKLVQAGRDVKEAVQITTQKAGPEMREMKDDITGEVHKAAVAVAEHTTTQPATNP